MNQDKQPEALQQTGETQGMWMTVVYRNIQPGDEAQKIGEHPKVSALSWSHALNTRDALHARIAELEAELAAVKASISGLKKRSDDWKWRALNAEEANTPQAVEPICWWRTGSTDVLHNFSYRAVKSPHWQPLYALAAPQAQDVQRDALTQAAREVLAAVEKLPRYTYGYKNDGESRYLSSYESPDGRFLDRAEVIAAIAASAKGGV